LSKIFAQKLNFQTKLFANKDIKKFKLESIDEKTKQYNGWRIILLKKKTSAKNLPATQENNIKLLSPHSLLLVNSPIVY
jgi:hypothetical protein